MIVILHKINSTKNSTMAHANSTSSITKITKTCPYIVAITGFASNVETDSCL